MAPVDRDLQTLHTGAMAGDILHVCPAVFGPAGITGGAERYVCELARYMAAVTPTRLVAFGAQASVTRIGALEIRTLGPAWAVRGQRTNPFHPTVFAQLRGARVVHCHQPHTLVASLTALAARLLRKRVFATDLGGGGWDISAYISTDRWFHGHLHISEYSRRIYNHATLPRARVILGGVDTAKFTPPPIPTQRRRALFVGRLLPHKGVDDLIEGLPQELGLDVVGPVCDAAFLDELRRLARGKDVNFVHDCGDERLVEFYRAALCIVLPSVYRARNGSETRVPELLGQTLLEGMACGAPAVTTAVASLPEIVRDQSTGFVVDANQPAALGDRLRLLAAEPARARAMGEAARRDVVDRFTWPKVVERCLAAYRGTTPDHEPTGASAPTTAG